MLDKYVLVYLISATRGGESRARIIEYLKNHPSNLNQLSKNLGLDYKTVQHHLNILEENGVISIIHKGKYGALYHLSRDMDANWKLFKEICK